MLKSKSRLLGLSALVGAGLIAAGPVSAANVKLGSWDVQIDNTASVGMSWLMRDVRGQYLPIANGGPADGSSYGAASAATKAVVDGKANGDYGALDGAGDFVNAADEATYGQALAGAAIGSGCDTGYGGYCQEIVAIPNFDGSINSDDGRLNFDKGDAYSAPIRLTTEIEASNGPIRAFARINAWHDAILMDEDFNRGGSLTDDGEENAGQNIELLDAFVSYDGDVGSMPYTVRLGKQVINWGEATFIPGGNSAFNPIDVAALRRPGAEIKEALLPVEALYGSIAVTQDLSLEAYVGGWEHYRLEAGGTPMGVSDSFTDGVSGGNPEDIYYIGGGFKSGDQFACDGVAPLGVLGGGDPTSPYTASAGIITAILAIPGAVNCATGKDAITDWDEGQAEVQRTASGDTNIVTGLDDEDGDEQFGLAVRYYSEALNSTEFALYYQKGDSRLPYISYQTGGEIGVKASSVSSKSSTVGRGAGVAGCAAMGQATAATGVLFYNPAYAAVAVNDEHDFLGNAAIQGIADATATGLAAAGAAAAAGDPMQLFAGYARSATPGDTIAYMQETNCLLNFAQLNSGVSLGSAFDGLGQLHTGATNFAPIPNIQLFAEFPEVETYGFSFNTTAFGWGVQGDFAFRPEMPLQFDTDSLTIAALFNNCAFTTVVALESIYQSGSTYATEHTGDVGCSNTDKYMQGYTTDHDVLTWDIGTTATFTRSNPVVSALRSDLGIFLTEFQGLIIDDIEDERGDTGGLGALGEAQGITPLSNTCVGGSDLPLNGILSIDDRTVGHAGDPSDDNPKGFCRTTDVSYGVVLMAQLQYNNVFGTPIGLKPQIIVSHGIEGYSPSPAGFWREGTGSTAFSLTADYLGSLSANLSYRTYHGDEERTKMLDRDNLSVSVTYAF